MINAAQNIKKTGLLGYFQGGAYYLHGFIFWLYFTLMDLSVPR